MDDPLAELTSGDVEGLINVPQNVVNVFKPD
jgi:hypothetical protein